MFGSILFCHVLTVESENVQVAARSEKLSVHVMCRMMTHDQLHVTWLIPCALELFFA